MKSVLKHRVVPFVFFVVFSWSAFGQSSWTQLVPAGGPPPARGAATAVWDNSMHQMVLFGGFNGVTYFNDVWSLNTSGGINQWIQLNPSGTPPAARIGASSVYDTANSRLIIFGGQVQAGTFLNDLWILTGATNGSPAWIQLTPSGTPPAAREFHSAVYDPGSNKMTVFGGQGSTEYNDVWVLSNANGIGGTPTWTELTPSGAPPQARAQHAAVYDPSSNRMVVFAGTPDGSTYLNDTWILSNANGIGGTPTWTMVTPTGTAPGGRGNFGAVYSQGDNEMILFGGTERTGLFYDTWVLSNANAIGGTPAWRQLPVLGPGPAISCGATGSGAGCRDLLTAVFDSSSARMIIFGGVNTSYLNDTWALPDPIAQLQTPAPPTAYPGPAITVLPGTQATFTWSSAPGADQYWLDVGTSYQVGNICAGATTSTSSTCTNIPCNAGTIYVQLWTHASGAWQTPKEYVYLACGFTLATMISPTPGVTLTGSSVTFTWNGTPGADQYWLDVGSSVGVGNFCAGATTNTRSTCSNIPITGGTIYVQLWTHISGAWQTPFRYTYMAPVIARAQLVTPANHSVLPGSAEPFTWTAVNGADQYWLDVGTALGMGNICAGATTNTSSTCTNIPTNGGTLYVQLWTHIAGAWQTPIQYTFTAANTPRAQLTSPANNSVFSGSSVTFTWTSITGADQYWLDVGTSLGVGNICAGATTNTASTCTNIPTNGGAIYVQLWTHIAGAWQTPIQYTFTANLIPRAQLTSPANGSVLPGSSVPFTWTSVAGADQYWLDVGTSIGHGDICAGATTSTSSTCADIPTNGSTIYVQLWTHIAGSWQTPLQYTFTAF